MSQQLVDFFINDGTDHNNRTLDIILSYSDGKLEATHDCIQWMFPLHEKSFHSVTSQVLDENDINQLQKSSIAKNNMLKTFDRICKFFGVLEHENTVKHPMWCRTGNHNLLRITRIVRSLRLFGLEKEAKQFHQAVSYVAEGEGNRFSSETFNYWNDALNDNITNSMTKRFLKAKRIDI